MLNNMKPIESKNAPAAIGPYSHAYVVNGIIYSSGQLPINAVTGDIPETIEEQAINCINNIKAILEENNSSIELVFKTTCYLVDINDFSKFNEIYARAFTSKPARSCFAVRDLPKNARCEIEVLAITK